MPATAAFSYGQRGERADLSELLRVLLLFTGSVFLSGYAGQEEADPVTALNQLTRYLFGYYGKRVFILSDEYDTPLQETYVYGYWKELRLMNRLSLSS